MGQAVAGTCNADSALREEELVVASVEQIIDPKAPLAPTLLCTQGAQKIETSPPQAPESEQPAVQLPAPTPPAEGAPKAAPMDDPSHADYVPKCLRHGPRELRHMRHLGLIPAGDDGAGARVRSNTSASTATMTPSSHATTLPSPLSPSAPAPAPPPAAAPPPKVERRPAAPASANLQQSDPSHPDYVPLALRYSAREERHLRKLGLLPPQAAAGGEDAVAAPAAARPVPARSAGRDDGKRGGQSQGHHGEKRMRRQEEEKKASAAAAEAEVRAFLAAHGFDRVGAERRSFLRSRYPLHVAVRRGDARMVGLLLDAGADAEARDSSGRSPLQLAQKLAGSGRGGSGGGSGGREEVVAALVARG